MSTNSQIQFWLIDGGTDDIYTLLNEGHRYGSKQAAIACMHPGESLWQITGAAIPEEEAQS